MDGEGYSAAAAKRRRQLARLEAGLPRALRLPMERDRFRRKLLRTAKTDPAEITAIILKSYFHNSKRVAREARAILEQVTEERAGMKGVLDNLAHPNREVRRAAVEFLKSKNGMHAVTYASFYENTALLIAMARNKDIPVDDIEALAETSKDSLLDGEPMEALQDIAASLDLVKHRHRVASTLKVYVSEVLRMAPDLTRIGAYSEGVESSLKRAISASKSHVIDETSDIISQRRTEASIRGALAKAGRTLQTTTKDRPDLPFDQMQGVDVWAIARMRPIMQAVTSQTLAGNREAGLAALDAYLKDDFVKFFEEVRGRLDENDPSAQMTAYALTITALKLASGMLPQAAEDLYQKHLRALEIEPSIHVVPWPEAVLVAVS
ncbi:MAG TPA: hypothetical protein VMB46_10110 [Methanomassiliicoccales archaeon]|nr:hypothetical protein [Methanomassiliicoccales archaeon]